MLEELAGEAVDDHALKLRSNIITGSSAFPTERKPIPPEGSHGKRLSPFVPLFFPRASAVGRLLSTMNLLFKTGHAILAAVPLFVAGCGRTFVFTKNNLNRIDV